MVLSTKDFIREGWIEMSIGIVFFAVRYAVRLKLEGVRRFRGDDYLGIFVLVNVSFSPDFIQEFILRKTRYGS
jgi:hypothetical protein